MIESVSYSLSTYQKIVEMKRLTNYFKIYQLFLADYTTNGKTLIAYSFKLAFLQLLKMISTILIVSSQYG